MLTRLAFTLLLGFPALVAAAPPDAPPGTIDRNARATRAEEILRLGASVAPEDEGTFLRILEEGADWERAIAAKAVTSRHSKRAIPTLVILERSADPIVEFEATVALHRLRPGRETLNHLERLRDRGGKLRRALQTGERSGRPTYPEEASAFFRGSVAHPLLMTRLDGALGLVELGGKYLAEGLEALTKAMASPTPDERRLAVRVMRVQYHEPAFVPLLESAANDPDETVRVLARGILTQVGVAVPDASAPPSATSAVRP